MSENILAVRPGKTIYREGNTLVKVFDESYAKPDILNEALNQARVENIGINVPKVLEVKMIDGKWAIVSEFIEGKTLAQLMQENPAKKDEYLEMFVDLQMQVHAAKCPMLNKLKDKMHRKISEGLGEQELAVLEALLAKSAQIFNPQPDSVYRGPVANA